MSARKWGTLAAIWTATITVMILIPLVPAVSRAVGDELWPMGVLAGFLAATAIWRKS